MIPLLLSLTLLAADPGAATGAANPAAAGRAPGAAGTASASSAAGASAPRAPSPAAAPSATAIGLKRCVDQMSMATEAVVPEGMAPEDYERAASALESATKLCDLPAEHAAVGVQAREAAASYRARAQLARTAASSPQALRKLIVRLLEDATNDRLRAGDPRLPQIFDRLRQAHPNALELAPRRVKVRFKTPKNFPPTLETAIVGQIADHLAALGFETVTGDKADAEDVLDVRAEPIVFSKDDTLGIGLSHCSLKAIGTWKTGNVLRFGAIDLSTSASDHTPTSCQSRLAGRGGSSAALELLRSWLRRNP